MGAQLGKTNSTVVVILVLDVVKDYVVFLVSGIHDADVVEFGYDETVNKTM